MLPPNPSLTNLHASGYKTQMYCYIPSGSKPQQHLDFLKPTGLASTYKPKTNQRNCNAECIMYRGNECYKRSFPGCTRWTDSK